MKQQKLRERIKELFERQGFDLKGEQPILTSKEDFELRLRVLSSEQFSTERALESINEGENVFVDEGLAELKDRVENDFSIIYEEEEEKDFDLPSYELIGDIAVINELVDTTKDKAVEGILHHNPQVETVLLKQGGLKGEFRVGDYEVIYGEETETVHKEHGCRYKVDPTKTYFSERFGTERKRVSDQIEEGEDVLVMFAGVGPFAVLAGKSGAESVVAVEKNPEAASYLKQNIELNGLEDTVVGIEGDVAAVVPELGMFDRVVMPLPETSERFLPLAFDHLKPDGFIHYYRFMEEDDRDSIVGEVREAAEKVGREFEIERIVKCGDRGAYLYRVCADINAE